MILVSPCLLPIPVVTFFAISILSSFTLNFSHFLLVCTIVFPFKSQSAPHYQHFCTPNLVYPALQHCKTLILFLCPASIYSSVAVCFPECFSQLLCPHPASVILSYIPSPETCFLRPLSFCAPLPIPSLLYVCSLPLARPVLPTDT